ncbi:hypothetical protein BC832DRAFT_540676 [Gaertneriomyces semiglobifer]|nr:hypothetical protein BC832DRAFT_540676 [Gaertneriomyces semiglobifer]
MAAANIEAAVDQTGQLKETIKPPSRQCVACGIARSRKSFSRNQWRMGSSARCKICMQAVERMPENTQRGQKRKVADVEQDGPDDLLGPACQKRKVDLGGCDYDDIGNESWSLPKLIWVDWIEEPLE